MKTKLKKIFLYCVTILILIGTSGFAAIAASQLDLSKLRPRDTFNSLAEKEAIAYVFKKCLKSIPGNAGSSNKAYDNSKNTIFNAVTGDETNISAGAWLEDEITEEVSDGEIECHEGKDKILSLFANAINLSKNDVLCNKDNNDYAGLIAKTTSKYESTSNYGGKWVYIDLNYGCSGVAYSGNDFSYNNNAGDNTVYGQTYKNGEQYVKMLYDHWVQESGYAGWINYWDQLGNFDEAVGHRITSRDFGHNCGWHKQPNDSGNNIVTIKNIWDDGTTSDDYYSYDSTKAVGNITGNATRTCSQLATRLNESFDAYSDAIKSIYQNDCQKVVKPAWDFEVQKANIIVSDTKDPRTVTGNINGEEVTWSNFTTDSEGKQVVVEFTEKEKEDAQAVIDALEALPRGEGPHGRYRKYYNTDEAPWTCTAPPEYEFTSVSTNSQDDDQTDCYDAGVEGMSWILCPTLSNTTTTVDLLEREIRNLLQINTNEIFKDATYESWTLFRDIANGILIIIFLLIIFSQLTGYGIDNYGIKKMLPKLVIFAVLINLSYILCEIAVDLSNILGVGLDNMFKALGTKLNPGITGEETLAAIVGGLFGALAGAGAIAGTAITIASIASGGGVMLVVSLIITVLVALVAVIMFFVSIGARLVIVIVFTVVSPIAFALYILPNTQGLFKKWWKIFQAALIVFPICGALYGMSYVIKAIVFNGNEVSFTMALVSVFVPFLPFLLIPSLLKGALAGLGVLGGTLATLGNGMKKGLSRGNDALKSTDKYKEQQQENSRRRQEGRAQSLINRLNKKQDKLRGEGKNLSDRDMRRLAGAHSVSDKLRKEDNAAQTILTEKEFGNKTEADLQAAWNNAFDNGGDNGKLAALTNVMTSRYGSGAANFMAKALASKNVAGNKNAQASMQILRDTMMANSTLAGNMKNKASDAFQMISNAGLVHNDETGENNYVNLDHYSANNAISKDVKDWSTQSADTLIRAIDSGALGGSTIEQILNSTDPSIQSGIQSDPGKASVLQAAMEGASGLGSMSKSDIENFAQKYKERLKTQAEDMKTATEQAAQEIKDSQRRYQEDTLNALNKINEQLGKHSGSSGGETFEGGAGI